MSPRFISFLLLLLLLTLILLTFRRLLNVTENKIKRKEQISFEPRLFQMFHFKLIYILLPNFLC